MSSPLETVPEKNSAGKKSVSAEKSASTDSRPPGLFDGSDLLADGGSNGGVGHGRRNPPAASLADHHAASLADHPADPLPGVPAVACPACGCPAVWMDGMGDQNDQGGQSDAGAALTAHPHCGGCEPPPAMSLARKWFLAVKGEKGKSVGGGNGSGDGDGSRHSLWEEWRPMFNLAKRKTKR